MEGSPSPLSSWAPQVALVVLANPPNARFFFFGGSAGSASPGSASRGCWLSAFTPGPSSGARRLPRAFGLGGASCSSGLGFLANLGTGFDFGFAEG